MRRVIVVAVVSLFFGADAYAFTTFADEVISFSPGSGTNSTGAEAVGGPACSGDAASLGEAGTIIVGFTDNVIIQGSGNDLKICENPSVVEGYSCVIG